MISIDNEKPNANDLEDMKKPLNSRILRICVIGNI
jgi:hypothetical protein